MKIVMSRENVGKVIEEDKFSCFVQGKGVGSNSTLCQFCRCWLHEICSVITGKVQSLASFNVR